MLHELAKYPKVQESLHKEVVSVLGKTGLPSAKDMESLPYVTACVQEALRCVDKYRLRSNQSEGCIQGVNWKYAPLNCWLLMTGLG